MTHVTCRLTAKNRDQLWNPALGNRVWATFTFLHISAQYNNMEMPTVNEVSDAKAALRKRQDDCE